MSSKPRLIISGVIYQVRASAARNEKIFNNDKMRIEFLKILQKKLKAHSFKCYAFSLEDTHYHLVLRTGSITISKFLQKVNSTFARRYNRFVGGVGVVFNRPFTSILVEENGLAELVRYVHLNAVRNQSCSIDNMENYKWCSHGDVLTRVQNSIVESEYVLNKFAETDKCRAFDDFVRAGFNDEDVLIKQIRDANSGKQKFCEPWHQVAGSDEFRRWAIKEDQSQRVKVPRYSLENVTLAQIQQVVEEMLFMNPGELMHQGRSNERSTAREMFAYVARYRYDYSGVAIAAHLKKTDSAVSRMISRFENVNQKDYLVDAVSELIPGLQCVAA